MTGYERLDPRDRLAARLAALFDIKHEFWITNCGESKCGFGEAGFGAMRLNGVKNGV